MGMYLNPGTRCIWKLVYIEPDANKWNTDTANILKYSDEQVNS
jgi:hypothetical protein